jgi:hypothetical protein
MNFKRALPYIFLLLLAGVVFVARTFRHSGYSSGRNKNEASSENRNRGFDRRTEFIEYTNHAKCRMDCRHITDKEVKEVMQNGAINYRKSNTDGRPCPTYALEGRTDENQRLRIVFAQCDLKSKVVTVIDLDTEWECHCPGDDEKYKNRN